MTFAEAAMIMMSGGGGGTKPVINSLSVAEPGEYRAEDYGCDGFDPVIVTSGGGGTEPVINPLSVVEPGEYKAEDYGYDGFDPVRVSDYYKKLYELYLKLYTQATVNAPDINDEIDEETVIDIPNAIDSEDIDALNELLTHMRFNPMGASVGVHGLGADTSFEFRKYVKKMIYANDDVAYAVTVRSTTKNLKTGETYVHTNNYYAAPVGENPFDVKITGVTFRSPTIIDITYDIISATGKIVHSGTEEGKCSNVNGTCFYKSGGFGTSYSQNSQPDETIDYRS